ncbi:peptidoglycan-recognition protein SA [Drosophila grimshawi]|uniref:Peptidoglycan-recognition protein n=1 Tax=Drosophila grimshawi TaxID=7222 RepID=B4JXA3_DROGR|nr:peptidoglycan-recognition protein SA [Drosophila grimshawi]EDV95379.1 GH17605 [Drosophila grimshawi]
MSQLLSLLIVGLLAVAATGVAGGRKDQKKAGDCPQMKLKRQWGGKPARGLDYQVRPVPFVIIHHTVTGECNSFVQCAEILQGMQTYHQTELNYYDIGYNFLIGSDGLVYEGKGWGVTGAHTYGYNGNGTGIAFIGNFVDKLPPTAALKACKQLIECGVKLGELSEDYGLIGASQVISTQSPGLTLYNEIQEWPQWLSNP